MKKIILALLMIVICSAVAWAMEGNGSIENPYQITTCLELQDMTLDINAHYIIMNDIDCSDTINWNGGTGFSHVDIQGSLDGQGHTIDSTYTNRDDGNAYLFDVRGGAILKNVHVTNGYSNVGNYAGAGMVGWNVGVIFNCSYQGDIVAGGYASWVGGLVGVNAGNLTYSHFVGTISGGQWPGGLMSACNDCYVSNCYVESNVGCGQNAGDIASGHGYGSGPGYITNTYAIGSGCAFGYWNQWVGKNVYAVDIAGINSHVLYDFNYTYPGWPEPPYYGEPKTDEEMKDINTYTGFDFDAIWSISPIINSGYPTLQGYVPPWGNCTENWTCGDWGDCMPSNTSTRICIDQNACGTFEFQPILVMSCTYQPNTGGGTNDNWPAPGDEPGNTYDPGDSTPPSEEGSSEQQTPPLAVIPLLDVPLEFNFKGMYEQLIILMQQIFAGNLGAVGKLFTSYWLELLITVVGIGLVITAGINMGKPKKGTKK